MSVFYRFLCVILGEILCVSFAFGNQKPTISVSIPPQAYFVEKIAKDTADIHILIPPNSDEHSLDFKPSAVVALQKSAAYFTIGLELEEILRQKFSSVKIIDISEGVEKMRDSNEHLHEHNHAHDLRKKHAHHSHDSRGHKDFHAHNHGDSHKNKRKDPHIWLDPIFAKIIAKNISKSLSEIYPQNAEFYAQNLADFEKELDSLHAQISQILSTSKGKKFIIYHPSLGYFVARYDLVQIPVEILGKEPKAKDLQAIINLAKKEKINTIFVQSGFATNPAKTLAKEIGANVIELNHLSREWDKTMLQIAHQIAKN